MPGVDVIWAWREYPRTVASVNVTLDPSEYPAAPLALLSLAVGVGHWAASVFKDGRTFPVRPAAPPWFVP